MQARQETPPAYNPPAFVAQALEWLQAQVIGRQAIESPAEVRSYLRLKLAGLEHEAFGVLWLDAQHRVMSCEELFTGTLTQTSVYPREVVKRALQVNAAAVILYHNHPSGIPEPSAADEKLTQQLKTACALVDVRVLDHIIVAAGGTVSLAERGSI